MKKKKKQKKEEKNSFKRGKHTYCDLLLFVAEDNSCIDEIKNSI